jgi:Tol biopolymer transport system component
MRPARLRALDACALTGSALALAQSPADAAFPGKNGRIAFDSNRDGDREIFTMTANGKRETPLTSNMIGDLRPVWSPNGQELAFWSDRPGNHDVHTMNADGTQVRRLTTSPGLDGDPAWSPSGSKIAFWSDREGDFEIFTMNADGTNQRQLTHNGALDGDPVYSRTVGPSPSRARWTAMPRSSR